MKQKREEYLEIKQFFYRIASNWLLFLISILLCLATAFGFNRYTKNIFKVSSTILFEDQSNISSISAAEAIYSNDPFQRSSKNLIANKIYEINSYPLIYQTLKDLNYDIEYYLVGNIKVSETYQSPFKVKVLSEKEKALNRSFKLTHLNNKKFRLYNKSLKIDSEFYYDKTINFLGAALKISRNKNFIIKEPEIPSCVVKFKDLQNLTKRYKSDLNFTQEQKKSSIVKIDLKCFDELKGVNFLNKLTENFIENEINAKNLSSIKTVEFINKQLFDMQDSLEIIENEIQLFKEKNGLTDLSVKAQGIYDQLNEIESKDNILKSEKEYLDYLSKYIQSENKLEQIKVPPSTIDEKSFLRSLIKDLIEVQFNRSLLVEAGKVKNPAVKLYDRTTNQIISSLNEAIFTSFNTLDIEIKRNNKIRNKLNSEINKLPEVERELLKIQRIQTINENIYTFLLRKKSEADITSSSNVADTRVLEPAVYFNKNPFLPKTSQNYLFALLVGFVLPLLFFLILDILNDKILSRFDLDKHSTIPVLGIIGTNRGGFNLLSKQSPKSVVYEGFRAIRSNLNFKIENNKSTVFLVTSSISGEGKTFFAENLAIVFAKASKKTILIGADLRKPKLWLDFELKNDIGLSSFINGDSNFNDIIKHVGIDNLDVVLSGPVPNNPADTLISDKFKSLIESLKKKYDIIILDTPPLGLVADSLTLMNYTDINLYMVRQGYTSKSLLTYSEDLYNKGRLGEMYIIFNDVKEGSGVYGYAYGYGGYGYGGYGYGGYGYGYGKGYGYGYGYGYGGYTNEKNSEYFEKDES
tara:strand:- start:91 stop:2511 length:2421 start_codon:yes stop_codon:yes gene_type:complete